MTKRENAGWQAVRWIVAVALLGFSLCLAVAQGQQAQFEFAGRFLNANGEWQKADINAANGQLVVEPRGRIKKNNKKDNPLSPRASLSPQAFIPAVVQWFVESDRKRKALKGLLIGAGSAVAMHFVLGRLRTRLDRALADASSGDRDAADSVYNALRNVVYAVVAVIGGSTAAGKTQRQYVQITTAAGQSSQQPGQTPKTHTPPRTIVLRVPPSEVKRFKDWLEGVCGC